MSFTLDTGGFRAALARVSAAVPAAVEANLPVAATRLVVEPPYAAPAAEETGPGPDPEELITAPVRTGTATSIGIAVLYDWVIDPEKQHCYAADGLDCPSLAAGGPYTLDTLPARPRDGTTPCGDSCGCQLVEREPTWTDTAPETLATLGADIWQDLRQAWGT